MISENSDRIHVLCELFVQCMINKNNGKIYVLCLLYVQIMLSENMSNVDSLFVSVSRLS